MYDGALPGASTEEVIAFGKEVDEIIKSMSAASLVLKNVTKKVKAMQKAAARAPDMSSGLNQKIFQLNQDLYVLDEEINGHHSKRSVGEGSAPTVRNRVWTASSGTRGSYGPTMTQRRNLEIAREEFVEVKAKLDKITSERLPELEKSLIEAGAPWMEGQTIPEAPN